MLMAVSSVRSSAVSSWAGHSCLSGVAQVAVGMHSGHMKLGTDWSELRAESLSALDQSNLQVRHLLYAEKLCCCLGKPLEARAVGGLCEGGYASG
jgi:hypothetical protein